MVNLVVGGDSQIGSALSDYWHENNIPFHATTRNKKMVSDNRLIINLNNIDTFQNLKIYKSAIICAAITDIEECEKNPGRTRKVNVVGTVELVKQLSKKGTHVIFLSSNQVFDGQYPMQKPNAPRKPITEYGRQKVEVEVFIEDLSNACILRMTKVIHPGMELLKNWKKSLSNGQPILAFTDLSVSPININDVIQKVDSLVQQKANGIFQLSGDKDISYFEFAQEFAVSNGFSEKLVIKDSWKNKLYFIPPVFTSLVNV